MYIVCHYDASYVYNILGAQGRVINNSTVFCMTDDIDLAFSVFLNKSLSLTSPWRYQSINGKNTSYQM